MNKSDFNSKEYIFKAYYNRTNTNPYLNKIQITNPYGRFLRKQNKITFALWRWYSSSSS